MGVLEQLERDYKQARERKARPELLKKLEDEIAKVRIEKAFDKDELPPKDGDLFKVLLEQTVDRISKQYIEGTISYVEEHHESLYEKTERAEDKLNEVWEAGLKGDSTLEEFKKVLEEWYLLNIREIEVYKKENID